MLGLFILAAVAAVLVLILTPLVLFLGRRWGVLDRPGPAKIHPRAVPRFGGVGVLAGWLAAVGFFVFFFDRANAVFWLKLGLPAAILFLTGLADDIWQIPPQLKLGLTILAGSVLCLVCPLAFSSLALAGLGYFLVILWTAFLTNAINLIDGLDGLASGLAALALMFLSWLAWSHGQTMIAVMAGAGTGAALGFLFFNWHPARIFLGDSGSYFLGGLLVTVTVGLLGGISYRIMPILVILALPAADSAVVLTCRVLAGRSLIHGDLEHTYNRLLKKTGHYRRTVLILYGLACLSGLVGTAMYFQNWWTNLIIFVTVVALVLILLRRIDYFKGKN